MDEEQLDILKKRDPSTNTEIPSRASQLKKIKSEAAEMSRYPSCNISYKNSNNSLTLFNEELVVKMLQSQLEFYLGDPNMKKDKYLQNHIKQSKKGYIGLEVFLRFNKIREIFMDASVSDTKKK